MHCQSSGHRPEACQVVCQQSHRPQLAWHPQRPCLQAVPEFGLWCAGRLLLSGADEQVGRHPLLVRARCH